MGSFFVVAKNKKCDWMKNREGGKRCTVLCKVKIKYYFKTGSESRSVTRYKKQTFSKYRSLFNYFNTNKGGSKVPTSLTPCHSNSLPTVSRLIKHRLDYKLKFVIRRS